MQTVEVSMLLDTATMPTRATPGAAGLDLYAAEDVLIEPHSYKTVETGIAIALPVDHVGLVWPRSGWAVRYGIDTLAGVIDCDYRGGVGVVLINHGDDTFEVSVGDRIAQLVVQRYEYVNLMAVDKLSKTHRDVRGFGSTG